MYKLYSEAQGIGDLTTSQIDEMISDLVCEGYDKVCISTDKKVIQRGKRDVFGISIFNVLDQIDPFTPSKFSVTIEPPPPPSPDGYTKDGTPITVTDSSKRLIIQPTTILLISIKQNQEVKKGVLISVPKDAVSGIYIFDVKINKQDGTEYSPVQKIYVEVP